MTKNLVIIPAHGEEGTVGGVVAAVRSTAAVDILVVDDGSHDRTGPRAAAAGAAVLRHEQKRGYGAAMRSGFEYASRFGYECVAAIDADGQHEPRDMPRFLELARHYDVVSGTRYHAASAVRGAAPFDRVSINREVTARLNRVTGWRLTDAFCGMKAYRTEALETLHLDEDGYAFPLQFWIQAYRAGLSIVEVPIDKIYLAVQRSFGDGLDDAQARRAYYLDVLERELAACRDPRARRQRRA